MCVFVISGALPSYAAEKTTGDIWGFGGGYWMMPNLDEDEVKVPTSGAYTCVQVMSENYIIEIDYALDEPNSLAIAIDYLYAFGGQGSKGGPFIGLGYTYFTAKELDNKSSFNVMLGSTFGDSILGIARYDILGSNQELLTIGLTYLLK